MSTWKCHICHQDRPDIQISVHVRDISKEHHLPPGTITENVRYCNDKQECIRGAQSFRFFEANSKVIAGRDPV